MEKLPDYLEFFGLRDHPFRLTPDTKYYFPSRAHQSVHDVLCFGLERGEGFLVLTGDPGSGKTMLLRLILKNNRPDKELALLLSPTLGPKELLMAILEDVGLTVEASKTKDYFLRQFRDYLLKLADEGKTLILVIDEAQNLPLESLEELRLLSNLETEEKKLLQILLVGQPTLGQKLRSSELAQLLQRITIWERLEPLSYEETIAYVQYRWHKAGGVNLELSRGAAKFLYQTSKGLPRQINKIMDRAVLLAAAEAKRNITWRHLAHALDSFGIPYKRPWLSLLWPWY